MYRSSWGRLRCLKILVFLQISAEIGEKSGKSGNWKISLHTLADTVCVQQSVVGPVFSPYLGVCIEHMNVCTFSFAGMLMSLLTCILAFKIMCLTSSKHPNPLPIWSYPDFQHCH